MDIFELAPIIQDSNKTIEFMHGHNLLLQDYMCCHTQCSKVMDCSLTDKQIFQCNVCKKRFSIRTGSFWSGSKLALNILLSLLFFFAQGLTVSETKKMMSKCVGYKSIIQWFNFFHDVCTSYFANHPVYFTNNSTVHVDETAIGGKRKYCHGRLPKTKTRWLFRLIDNNLHKAYVQFVPKRDFINIIPIITRKVQPGAKINTDGAKVYKTLDSMNYEHNTVIHKTHFVNPENNEHTNWIENFWNNLKYHLKIVKGSQGKMTDGHIDEYLYRYNRRHEGSIFNLLIQDISIFYPV